MKYKKVMVNEMIKEKEIIEVILNNRVYLYELLHTVFAGVPNEELLKIIGNEHTEMAFYIISDGEDSILYKMSKFVRTIDDKVKEDSEYLSNVKSEYMRLLVGPGRLIAYPWASTYLGKEKILFQESTLKVREIYRKYGFRTHEYKKVADDHIAIELHFMSKMSQIVKEAFESDNEEKMIYFLKAQVEFIKEHMLKWIPKYTKNIQTARTTYLYAQFAEAVEAFINTDLEIIEKDILL